MRRVIPRDFFNYAKLLKCLGHVELLILDRRSQLTSQYDGEPFDIEQDESDGSLSCSNYRVFCDGEEVQLCTVYNSRHEFPLLATYRNEVFYMFDAKGKPMPDWVMRKEVNHV